MIALIIVAFVVLGRYRPVWAFYASVFFAPWQELMVDAGLRLTFFTLSLLGLLSAVYAQSYKVLQITYSDRLYRPLLVFLVWALLISLVQIIFLPEAQVSGGVMRNGSLRPLVQLLSFVLMLIPLFTAPFLLTITENLLGLAKSFFISITILLIIGWWQILVAEFSGTNPLPMGTINAWLGGMSSGTRSAIDLGYGGKIIHRMSSLGGEPRWLSQSIATALLLLQIFIGYRLLALTWWTCGLFIFFFVSLLATQSMSGFYLWLLGGAALLVHHFWRNRSLKVSRLFTSRIWIVGGLLSIFITSGILLYISKSPPDFIGGNYLWYVFQRIAMRGLITDFDKVVLDFLIAEPWYGIMGVGMGNIHLFADAYLPNYLSSFAGGTSFVADSGWLRLLSELGLVGLCLFLWWGYRCMLLMLALDSKSSSTSISSICAPIALIAFVGYLARGTSFAPIAFFLLAICFVAIKIAESADHRVKPQT